MLSNPFELATRQAALKGACPVQELDDFYTNHWDFPTLCSDFRCALCVAMPEDMGYVGWEPLPEAEADHEEEEWEIPF